ncbi:MAG: hypothetical protein RLZZ282_1201 [Verrucomicrobiota bacterium]
MRVPIPWVLLLSLVTIGSVGWLGARKCDFLTPPTAAQLAACRKKIELSLKHSQHVANVAASPAVVVAPPVSPPLEEPKPTMILGDFSTPPTLREYCDLAPKGAAHLIDLAVLLEVEGEIQRALLAWERVLDTGKPDPAQINTACAAIKRLRPTLPDGNPTRTKPIALTLHAGTSSKTTQPLTLALTEIARELERASAGLLQITPAVSVGRVKGIPSKPTSVAVWLTGPLKSSASTAMLTFPLKSTKPLREDLLKSLLTLTRCHLVRATTHSPPPSMDQDQNPLDALYSQITRLNWLELGASLNRPEKKNE